MPIRLPAALAALFVAGVAFGQTPAEIVSKAVAAHGGADRLTRYPAARVVSRGTLTRADGTEASFTDDRAFRAPDCVRTTLRVSAGLVGTEVVHVVHGPRAAAAHDGKPVAVDDRLRNEVLDGLYVQQLARLAPLLAAPYRLSPVPESECLQVAGRPTIGVSVSCEGRRDVKLFFDRDNGLLVKAVRPRTAPDGREESLEQYFLDHRDFEGVIRPGRTVVWMGERKLVEAVILAYAECESIPDAVFDAP